MSVSAASTATAQHVGADGDVLLDLIEFVGRERSGLLSRRSGIEHRCRATALPLIASSSCSFDGLSARAAQALNALRVLVRRLVACGHGARRLDNRKHGTLITTLNDEDIIDIAAAI